MKYEILWAESQQVDGVTLYRIRALRDIPARNVKAGDRGGWIAGEHNLSQDGDAWVADEAIASGYAIISGRALVAAGAWVSGDAHVFGDAVVAGRSRVYGDAVVYDSARVLHDAHVYGHAVVCGNAEVYNNAHVYGRVEVCGDMLVSNTWQIMRSDEMSFPDWLAVLDNAAQCVGVPVDVGDAALFDLYEFGYAPVPSLIAARFNP